MPTYNRREFVPHAIRYFLRQDYKNKELIIVDDGADGIEDLIPETPSIHYLRLDWKITLGAKLNLACKHAKGEIIANWDDDDWYASRRLQYQVDALQQHGTSLCGINKLLYYDLRNNNAYQYIYPPEHRTWLLGSSLCYTKELWNSNHFADVNVGMDGLFVWGTSADKIKVLSDFSLAVHMIHSDNVSPKKTDGWWWQKYPVEEIKKIMDTDWTFYNNGGFIAAKENVPTHSIRKPSFISQNRQLKNIYACLVHENEDCIIDLVRNLHYHDPASTILIFNGGEDPHLIKKRFPFDTFGAVLHPQPTPVKHGYLHDFALNCMQFALNNFSFDSFTIVDSDQLSIRSGYSAYMEEFFSHTSNIGMLSSRPKRLTFDDTNDGAFWPAIQAFKEYDLWKPFLKQFADGESKFVHWTFWPSTVFTADAVRDLTRLFRESKLLKEIMGRSKIWATEEVILPTLVRLLGYEIALNPCSYDFVRFKKSYNLQDVNQAFNKSDSYWIHPIERKYEDPLRKRTREEFNHYVIEKHDTCQNGNCPQNSLLTTSSLIKKVKNIEGWLEDEEADLLIALTLKACKQSPSPHIIVEIGSYHGKATILLGSIVKAYFPESKIYSIDPHDGKLGAADMGLQSFPPSYETFKQNLGDAGLSEVIEMITDHCYNVKWEAPISMLLIDGLHDYPNVASDFRHFSDWIKPAGYVAFHDYADYFPGVKAFVDELSGTGTYKKVHQAKSLIVLQKL